MNLFLQDTPVGYTDLYWIIGAVVTVVICYFYWLKFGRDQKRREHQQRDLRSHIVNDSNYNLHRTGMDNHRVGVDSDEEVQAGIDQLKSTDTIPTREEFRELRQDLRKS